ncbi:MAG: DUF3006 domain-containing protein [Clostridia bacterium]|nr:DUF3006 domain-containing protein [Clostridia bacterium]
MLIETILDRFENGCAILLSDEMGIEIDIPDEKIKGTYKEGETVYLTLDKAGNPNL